MSKNLTRKGLALGATLALGASVFAGAPALAAGELRLEPAAGTVYAVPATTQFTLVTSWAGAAGDITKLKYKLTSNGQYRIDAKGSATQSTAESSPGSALAVGTLSASVTPADSATSPNYLAIEIDSASSSTVDTAVTVQAYVDGNSNGAIDSGEWTSEVRTVNFLKESNVNWTADLVDPVRTNTTSVVHVTSTNINLEQLTNGTTTSQIAAVFYNGSDIVFTNTANSGYNVATDADIAAVALAWNSTYGYLEGTSATHGSLAAGGSVKVDVFYEATAAAETSAALDIAIGGADGVVATTNANDAAVVTRTEAVAASQLTALSNVAADASANNTAISNTASDSTAGTGSIKTGAGSFTLKSTATLASGVTSTNVTFTIGEDAATSSGANTIDAAATVTAGGKTLQNTNLGSRQKIEVVVPTDKDGLATLTVTYTGLKVGNKLDVASSAQGYGGDADNSSILTVADAAATTLYNVNAIRTNLSSNKAQINIAKDTALTLNYVVLDQFGAALNVAGHSVTVSDGTNSWSGSVGSDGKASVSIPAYTAATTKTMTPTVYKNGSDVSISEPTVSLAVGATITAPSSVTATLTNETSSATNADGARADLNLKANAAADSRTGAAAPTVTASTKVTLAGQVKDALGNGTPSSVTITGAGLMFVADGVYALGSITVLSASDGNYDVGIYSNVAGKQSVSIAAGAATKSVDVYFIASVATTAGTPVIVAPSVVKPGAAVNFVVKVTDKFGNAVDTDATATNRNSQSSDSDTTDLGETATNFKMSYSGPGFPLTSSITGTDEDGLAEMKVLFGTADAGVGTIKVQYDTNDDGDYSDAADFTLTKTVLVGVSAKITKAATSSAVVKNAAGATIKVVRGTKSTTKVATSNSQKVTVKGGSGTVKVYVNGIKVASK